MKKNLCAILILTIMLTACSGVPAVEETALLSPTVSTPAYLTDKDIIAAASNNELRVPVCFGRLDVLL